jgi:hypothetical protein
MGILAAGGGSEGEHQQRQQGRAHSNLLNLSVRISPFLMNLINYN